MCRLAAIGVAPEELTTYFEADIRDERELIEAIKSGRFYAVDMRSGKPVPARALPSEA